MNYLANTISVSLVFIATGFLQFARADLPQDPAAYKEWETTTLAAIENVKTMPKEEAIARLGNLLTWISNPYTRNYEKGERPVSNAARSALMEIPGHTEYYRDRILEARAKMEAEPDQALRDDMYHRTMAKVVGGFGVLGMLPSPASVRVLGDFLSDERGRYTITPEDEAMGFDRIAWVKSVRTSNCESAASSMKLLPLVDKPVGKDVTGYAAVLAWREWYERIKSGRATFRFEGDPVEYDLDGPAPPEKLALIAADRKRDAERENRRTGPAAGDETSSSKGDTPAEGVSPVSRLPLLLAGGFLAVVLGWYLFRRIKRDPA